ncbi:MAG: hypothetical protein LC790_18610 [Actinobacteria bacterium]|nr:hypothetical protein [Actinomycetota bacterium]
MLRVTVTAETSATPKQVLALAGTDFSAQRAKIWPNVTAKRLEVHKRGDTYTEVTEGATGIAWFAWERSRYDWSQPTTVTQTVLDSNVLEQGSSWELRVARREDGGSNVQMTLERSFRRTPAGTVAYTLNHLAGRRGWSFYLRSALKAVAQAPEHATGSDAPRAAA